MKKLALLCVLFLGCGSVGLKQISTTPKINIADTKTENRGETAQFQFSFDVPASEEKHVKPSIPAGEYYVPVLKLDDDVDSKIVKKLLKEIDWANEDKAAAIILEINSYGGSVDEGFRLSKAIEDSAIPVHCVVDGDADSMAFYILQSCTTRSMTRRSIAMAHQPSIGGMFNGQYNSWINIAERLKVLEDGMVEHLCSRMKVSTAFMHKKIAGGSMWWMSWQDARKYGAVDAVVRGSKEFEESYRKGNKPSKNLAK